MKNIFIFAISIFCLYSFTIMGMEPSCTLVGMWEPAWYFFEDDRPSALPELPQELLNIVSHLAQIPKTICSIKETTYSIDEHRGKKGHYKRLLPTSFGKSPLHICRGHYWHGWLDHVTSKPENSQIGFETGSGWLGSSNNTPGEMEVPYTDNDNGAIDEFAPVDSNALNQGCVAYSYPSANKHRLKFFNKRKPEWSNGKLMLDGKVWYEQEKSTNMKYRPGTVTALTIYPNTHRVVYLTSYCASFRDKVWGKTMQRMVVAERDNNGNTLVKLSAPTPDEFKEIVPFETDCVHSHFALSKDGEIWKIFGKDGAMQYSKQIVRDRSGQKKTYQHIAMNEEGLIATLDHEGTIFVGDPKFRLKPVLLALHTIPNPGNVIRFSHTKNTSGTGSTIYAVYDKSFLDGGIRVLALDDSHSLYAEFKDSHPVIAIEYNYNALILNYWNKNKLMLNH